MYGWDYIRILISGELTSEKFIKIHQDKELLDVFSIGIHYDIYPSTNLNVFLRCIIGGNEEIFHIPPETSFFMEVTHNLLPKIEDYLFGYFDVT
jgi:hypothetical protein